jgi:hypothetical protein
MHLSTRDTRRVDNTDKMHICAILFRLPEYIGFHNTTHNTYVSHWLLFGLGLAQALLRLDAEPAVFKLGLVDMLAVKHVAL